MVLSIAQNNCGGSSLPLDAREDVSEALSRLSDDLDECKNKLRTDHLLGDYKKCVVDKLNTFDDEVWNVLEDIKQSNFDSGENFDSSCSCELKNFIWLTLIGILVIII